MSITIACISDTHGQEEYLRIAETDILVHCGDFSNLGSVKEFERFAAWLKKQPQKQIFISPGNHDGLTQEDPDQARAIIEGSRPGVRLMLHEAAEIDGKKWFFSPWTPEWAGWWWMLGREEIAAKWAEIPDDTEVLITHGPPKGILDTVEREIGVNAGCADLYHRVGQLKQLRHHFYGHLHHSHGQIFVHNGVSFHNCAVLDDKNRLCDTAQILTF